MEQPIIAMEENNHPFWAHDENITIWKENEALLLVASRGHIRELYSGIKVDEVPNQASATGWYDEDDSTLWNIAKAYRNAEVGFVPHIIEIRTVKPEEVPDVAKFMMAFYLSNDRSGKGIIESVSPAIARSMGIAPDIINN